MSYQVLYRAWRPGTFSEIVGQDATVRTLRRQVVIGRIAHAYLFCGTRGTGKTTAAKVLSKAINCLQPKDGDPCGECAVCRALQSETCMDVMEIDAASNNGVDEIRELREKIKYPPSVTRYKVYIIDEVHMLSSGAFNALLKTLEEPPSHAVFILATTEPQKLPATILSRCQRFDFRRISAEDLVARMKIVLNGIGREADDDALDEIARAAEGAMRDALSLLDCCLSYTDSSVTLSLARDVLGTAGRAFMFDFTDALIDFDAANALRLIDEMMRRGCDPQVFCRDTVSHLRAILLAQSVGDISGIAEVTPEDAIRFSAQAKQLSGSKLTRMMTLFMNAEGDMKWTSRPRTMLELTAVRACRPEEESDATMTERIEKIEKMLENGILPAPKAPSKKTEAAPPNKPEEKVAPAERTATGEIPEFYNRAIETFCQDMPSARSMLNNAKFLNLTGETITLEFQKRNRLQMSMLEKKKAAFEETLSEIAGEPIELRLLIEGDGKPAVPVLDKPIRAAMTAAQDIFPAEKIDLID